MDDPTTHGSANRCSNGISTGSKRSPPTTDTIGTNYVENFGKRA
jgi:hypothetical protein